MAALVATTMPANTAPANEANSPAKLPALPLPPPVSPKDNAGTKTTPTTAIPGVTPDRPDERKLTEDDVYGAYQRGYFIEAFVLATELATRDIPEAMTMLGHLYDVGQGVKADDKRAVEWYRLAADRGDREAEVALALLYLQGRGVPVDKAKARDLFIAAAAKDQPVALYNLALMRIEGVVLPSDFAKARDEMHRAAELGNAEAQYAYAKMLDETGDDATQKEITYWLGMAARAGHVPAEVEYALRIARGRGSAVDLETAVLFLNRAAYAGNPIAQNRIARLIATGVGLPFNDVEAAKWHLLAKAAGVKDPQLEDMMSTMKPEELEKARGLAAAFPGGDLSIKPTPLIPLNSSLADFDLRGPSDLILAVPPKPAAPQPSNTPQVKAP
jgi:TPR repeat protein